MTIRTGDGPRSPRVNAIRARGNAAPAHRDGTRSPVPAQRSAPADDTDSWLQRGACGTVTPELFFPVSPGGASASSQRQIAEAQAVCNRCPVIEDCRTWALANPRLTEHGVWAGTTEEERRSARRRADRASGRTTSSATQQTQAAPTD